MPSIDTGRGLRSQRLRLTPSPDGALLLVHRSDLHPAALPATGPLLRHGRVVYDLHRRESVSARLSRGTTFVVDADSTRIVSRSSTSAAAWDPTSTKILVINDDTGSPTPTAWTTEGDWTQWPRIRAASSLLGFRGRDERQPGVGWTVDGSPLLLTPTRPGPSRLVRDASTLNWDNRTVQALWDAAACDLTVLTYGGGHPIREGVVVVAMDVSRCGTTVLLGMIADQGELHQFLQTDLVPYWVLHLTVDAPPQWTDVGVLLRDSVRLVEDSSTPAVIYLEASKPGTIVWDAVTGNQLAEFTHDVAAHAGIPGLSGCWAAPGSDRLVFTHGDVTVSGPIRDIQTVPGSDLMEFDIDIAGAPGPWAVRARPGQQREVRPAGPICTYRSPTHQQTIEITENQATLTLQAGHRSRNVTLWGRAKTNPVQRRLRWIDSLPFGPLLSVTAPTTATDEPPLLWLEPVMTAQIRLPSEARQVVDDPLVPGSPEWCHSERRMVIRAMLPLDWSSAATIESVTARIIQTVTAACDWLAAQVPGADSRYVLCGHSFGAAAAMLAASAGSFHPDCLLLRSGSYDRLLTPAGFQWERRSVLEAPDIYRGFTLIDKADAVRCPVLLIHGSADHNLSTPAAQSRAMFDALQAAGRTARFVELVGEGHEIITRVAARTVAEQEHCWLQLHSPPRPAEFHAARESADRNGAPCPR